MRTEKCTTFTTWWPEIKKQFTRVDVAVALKNLNARLIRPHQSTANTCMLYSKRHLELDVHVL